MKVKVAERGQVTIPKILRERLGIKPGTILEFHEEEGRLIAVKATSQSSVDEWYGILGQGRRTDDVLAELRDGS